MKSVERQYQDEFDILKSQLDALVRDLRTLGRLWEGEAKEWGSDSDWADRVRAGKGRAAKELHETISFWQRVNNFADGDYNENPNAQALGKLGGKVKSEAKAAAARENGKKGGRPRKVTNPKA